MKALAWAFCAVLMGCYITGPIVDPDLWWHITVGKWIIANGTVPATDHWNLYGYGKPWRAYSWSNEILFALADRYGNHGLLALKIVIAALLALSLFYCMSRIAGDWLFGAGLGIYTTAACFQHYTLRPQSVVWICFAWLALQLDRIEREGASPGRLLACAAIMCVWANSHLTAALGLILSAVWLFKPDRWKTAALVAVVCFAGTLLTPYLGGEWLTFFSKTTHPLQLSSIVEFKPATILEYPTAFLLVGIFLLCVFAHFQPTFMDPAKAFGVCGFVIAGLAVTKFIPIANIFVALIIAVFWRRARESGVALGNFTEAVERSRAFVARLPGEGLAFVFLCAIAVTVNRAWAYPLRYSVIPVLALDYILEKELPYPLLNTFGNGGYVMYRHSDQRGELKPEQRVPIDGRTNVMSHEAWTGFSDAFYGRQGWRAYIDLVKPQTILWRRESPFASLVKASREWCEVFTSGEPDDGYTVLVKREYFDSHRDKFPGVECN